MLQSLENIFYSTYSIWYQFFGVTFSSSTPTPVIWQEKRQVDLVTWADQAIMFVTSGSWFLISRIIDGGYGWYWEIFFGIVVVSALFAIILDYLTLSEISTYNKRKNVENPNNTFFSYFFVTWRIFLPDIFIASSIAALASRMTLTKKQILTRVLLVQILRIALIILIIWLNPFNTQVIYFWILK